MDEFGTDVRGSRHNQLDTYLGSVEWCRFCRGSKFSNFLLASPVAVNTSLALLHAQPVHDWAN